jgi:hypothetical protein
MSTRHTTATNHHNSDGSSTREVTTTYPDGSSKTYVHDSTDRNVFYDGPVIEVTKTDSHGNSTTEKCR